MALLLETTLGDLVIDLDIEGSPELCKNVLKLAKARYYTSNLIYNIQANRFCQFGDPFGDGTGGACIYGLMDVDGSSEKVLKSQQRFLKSDMGRPLTEEECREKGRVVATEMNGIPNTLGSQLLITISEGKDNSLDGFIPSSKSFSADAKGRPLFRSLGVVSEDTNNILDQLASTYCDPDGRPYADVRIIRALVVDDPFDDPSGLQKLMIGRGIDFDENSRVTASPDYERPPEEKVEIRISADQIDPLTGEEDLAQMKEKEEELLKRQDKSRAVVLEMLGDLPSADIQAPENVLFVCKLNPVTEDEDLELIFSRFDEKVKAEIIRDPETGNSLQYAFIEFTEKQQAVEAYFKMNNALVDDRRIKVDFSQSVAKVWNKYSQRARNPSGKRSNIDMPRNPFGDGGFGSRNPKRFDSSAKQDRSRGGDSRGKGRVDSDSDRNRRSHGNHHSHHRDQRRHDTSRHVEEGLDQYGRKSTWKHSDAAGDDSQQKYVKKTIEQRDNRRDQMNENKDEISPSDRRHKRHRSRSRDRHDSRTHRSRHEWRHDSRREERDQHRQQEDGNRHERKHDHRSPRDRSPQRRHRSDEEEAEKDGHGHGKHRRRDRERKQDDRNRKERHEDSGDDSKNEDRYRRRRGDGGSDDSRERTRHRRKHKSSKHSRRHDSSSDSDNSRHDRHNKDEGGRDSGRRSRHDSRERHDGSKKRHRDGKKSKRHREDRGDRKRQRRSRSASAS